MVRYLQELFTKEFKKIFIDAKPPSTPKNVSSPSMQTSSVPRGRSPSDDDEIFTPTKHQPSSRKLADDDEFDDDYDSDE